MAEQRAPERARFYTSTRRIPVVFGKLPTGEKLWGGPYTSWQLIALVLALPIAWIVLVAVGITSTIVVAVMSLLIAFGAGIAAGRIPTDIRNPLAIVSEAFGAVTAPTRGRVAGQPLVFAAAGSIPFNARRHVAAARELLGGARAFEAAARTEEDWQPLPVAPLVEADDPQPTPALPPTGVQRLLAIAQSREER